MHDHKNYNSAHIYIEINLREVFAALFETAQKKQKRI